MLHVGVGVVGDVAGVMFVLLAYLDDLGVSFVDQALSLSGVDFMLWILKGRHCSLLLL